MPSEFPGPGLPARGFQHPTRDPLRDRRSIHHRHELRRRNETAFGVTPSDQRLGANQTAVYQTDLRLIEQLELFSFDRKRKFGLQLQPRFKLLPNGVLKHHIATTPGRLGTAEGQMAVAEHLVRRSSSLRMDGHPDTNVDAVQPRSRG